MKFKSLWGSWVNSVSVDGLSATSGECSAGWFCTGGSYMAQPVTLDNATSLPDCSCPAANFTGGRCWPGTYCPNGTANPLACTLGMYCGQYELESPTGQCDAGYFCNGSAFRPDPPEGLCPPGYYCEQGSGTPTPCPAGTMSNVNGATNDTYCELCTAGYYCAGPADTNYTGPCAAGYYCPPGQSSSTPEAYNCTIGHYCPGETGEPLACPAGEYQDELLQSNCTVCPPGR